MSISVSSTELLDMDHGASGRKDGEKLSGLFVSHRCLAFMVLAVVVALLAVGLMAGYLGEKRGVDTVKRSPLAATAQQMDIQKPEKNVRLPKSVKPMHYALELKPDLEDTFTFVGSVAVTILCITETDNVKLHTNKLDVFNVSVHKEGSGEVVPFGAVQKVDDLEFLVVPLGRKLEKGASYVLRMGFNGTLADDLAGFYRSSYKTTDNKIRANTVPETSKNKAPAPVRPIPETSTTNCPHRQEMSKVATPPKPDVAPAKKQDSHQKPRSFTPTAKTSSTAAQSDVLKICLNCKKHGHFVTRCPEPLSREFRDWQESFLASPSLPSPQGN